MNFTVIADNLVGAEKGQTITADDLPAGTIIGALVASGHLEPVKTAVPSVAYKSQVPATQESD